MNFNFKKVYLIPFILLLAGTFIFLQWSIDSSDTLKKTTINGDRTQILVDKSPKTDPNVTEPNLVKNKEVPKAALETLKYIRKYNKAPDGYEGGRIFFNREKKLPIKDINGSKIKYQEWDIYKLRKGKNRGPHRLVTSSSKAYYTYDHYETFILIQE